MSKCKKCNSKTNVTFNNLCPTCLEKKENIIVTKNKKGNKKTTVNMSGSKFKNTFINFN